MKPRIGVTMNAVGPDEDRRPSTFGSHYVNYAYTDALRRAGAIPLALPYGDDADVPDVLCTVQGLLVTGGKDVDPSIYGAHRHTKSQRTIIEKSRYELALLTAADHLDIPVLGICLGCQLINVARGGTLHQHLPDERPSKVRHPCPEDQRTSTTHDVVVVPGSHLSSLCGEGHLPVNSLHHQGIRDLGRALVVAARAEDGLVEAIEDPARSFLVGVQWHPEDLPDRPRHAALFTALVEACRAR